MNTIAIQIDEIAPRKRTTYVEVIHIEPEALLQKIALQKYNQLKVLMPKIELHLTDKYASLYLAGTLVINYKVVVQYIPTNVEEEV